MSKVNLSEGGRYFPVWRYCHICWKEQQMYIYLNEPIREQVAWYDWSEQGGLFYCDEHPPRRPLQEA